MMTVQTLLDNFYYLFSFLNSNDDSWHTYILPKFMENASKCFNSEYDICYKGLTYTLSNYESSLLFLVRSYGFV